MGPREIQRGQTLSGLPANDWNAFVAATRKINALVGHGNGQASSDRGSTVYCQILNRAELLIPAGGMVRLGNVILSPTDREAVVFEGLQFDAFKPDEQPRAPFWAVAQEPIEDLKLGWAVIPGAFWARLNVIDEDHLYAEQTDTLNEFYFDSKRFRGLPIVWKEEGTGEKWAVLWLRGTGIELGHANELIDAMSVDADAAEGSSGYMGGIGEVEFDPGIETNFFDCINCTGRPIWDTSRVYMNDRGLILKSDAADLLYGTWDGSGSKTNVESYSLSAASLGNYTSTGVVNARFVISDPQSLLTDVTTDDPEVLFSTGAQDTSPFNVLRVISAKGAGGGGGGFPWPGPGTEPNPGTATVSICIADVNDGTGVASTDGSIAFDNASAIIGTAPGGGTGTASNDTEKPFSDNEPFIIVSTNGATWSGWKIGANVIKAQVNNTSGIKETDTTFAYNNVSTIYGVGPGASGTADNLYSDEYSHGEWVVLIQPNNNGNWQPITKGMPFFVLKGSPTALVTGASTTFTISAPTSVIGRVPNGAITVKNEPPCRIETSDTVYVVYDRTAGSTIATRWNTGHLKNLTFALRGYSGYTAASGEWQALVHENGSIKWVEMTISNPA